MKIIAVDDEALMLGLLTKSIKEALPQAEVHGFHDAKSAISFAEHHHCDVAFLDIQLRGDMDGLLLAKRLKEIYGRINIVFATAYSQHALDAFALHASGYLLKPINPQKVTDALHSLRYPIIMGTGKRVYIQTFGMFEVYVDQIPLHFTRTKAKELLAFLVTKQGALCSNNDIVTTLWESKPDSLGLQSQFRHLVLDLRRALQEHGVEDILLRRRGSMAVVPGKVDCDFYDFCQGIPEAVNRYQGEFMTQYSWAEFLNGYLAGSDPAD